MPGDEIISELRSLGLHLNEAKAYKALVTLGQSTARAVADHSGVPRSKVYDVLYSLEDRGLVRRVLGSDPTEFKSYPPKDAIPYLIEKLQQSGSVVMKALETIEQERNTESRELVYTVEGQDQIKMEMRGIIGEAQKEVFIATLNPAVLSAARPALAEAKRRNVNIQLFTAGANMEEWKEFTHYLEMTNVEGIGPTGLIEQMSTVIEDVAIVDAGWNPTQMGIVIADNSESIGMFGTHSAQMKPWALVVRVPLIAILQRQVITAVLSQVQRFIAAMEATS
ncbi:MAG: TrmB family transcriptional regulator [Candidatus Thorarchaeota archaeon SMTZ1-83]|nr:MAG: hypothetical protein AM324_05565 [Candidatus Thorarchaeota archaeon SMTZ1-83]